MAFIEGYLLGLSLIILIGPVFFVLLYSTLEHGIMNGLAVALGIFISDVFIVGICLQGGEDWLKSEMVQMALTGGGGVITLGLGIHYLKTQPLSLLEKPDLNSRGVFSFFIKGFAVNFINPFVFLVWLGILSTVQYRYPTYSQQLLFLSATLAGILTLDLSKVFLAQSIKSLLKPQFLKRILKGSGFILILFSLRLLFLFMTS